MVLQSRMKKWRKNMSDSIAITLEQKLLIEKTKREIDSTRSVEDLRKMAKNLLLLWMQQRAACAWVLRNK